MSEKGSGNIASDWSFIFAITILLMVSMTGVLPSSSSSDEVQRIGARISLPFEDNFENNNIDVWNNASDPHGSIKVETGNLDGTGNRFLYLDSPPEPDNQARAILENGLDQSWNNYVLEFDTKIDYSSGAYAYINIFFNLQSESNIDNGYYIQMKAYQDDIDLIKRVDGVNSLLTRVSRSINISTTYHVKVIINNDRIQQYVDGNRVLDYNDSIYTYGTIGFATHGAGAETVKTAFDNVIVSPFTNLPENTNPTFTVHRPIYIHGNDNFSEENGVTSGNGTEDNPFLIEGWDINASWQDGIVLRNISAHFVIKNGCIHSGGMKNDGIVFYNVTNGIVENNTITMNRNGLTFGGNFNGIGGNNNLIKYNALTFNNYDGINFAHIGGGHRLNTMSYNNISNNGRGIYMITSAENMISYNNITSNDGLAILLSMCDGGGEHNKVHHNNIVNNGEGVSQASSNGDNFWNDRYPFGGNYWSDYSGNDIYLGENQSEIGSDGIGDTPYNISSFYSNQDIYPRMNPINIKINRPLIPPSINFTYSPNIPNAMKNVRFSDTSADFDGSIESWFWNFGDGVTSTLQNPIHQYADDGIYTVQLVVTDNDGLSVMLTKEITVVNAIPVANFSYLPINPTDMDEIQFFDASIDPDAIGNDSIVNWTWNFSDGNISYDQNAVHLFNEDGVYNVTLKVRDIDGWENNKSKSISVLNVPPLINITFSPTNPIIREIVEFNSTGSIDLDGEIVSWNWSFGDGNYSSKQNPTHSYSIAGIYSITLIIIDDDGAITTIMDSIEVRATSNELLIAIINASPLTGKAPLTVSFSGMGIDKDGIIVSYFWDFGGLDNSKEQNTAYTFQNHGNYTITLTVMDNNNSSASDSIIIVVKPEIDPFPDADSDNDTYNDTYELSQGSDPYNPLSTPLDWDADGWNNSIETEVGTDPRNNLSVPLDTDTDGIPDSLDPDRDGDGVPNVDDAYPDDGDRWEGQKIVEKGDSAVWWIGGVVVAGLMLGAILGVVLVTRRKEIDEEEIKDCAVDELGRIGRIEDRDGVEVKEEGGG